MNFKSHCLSLQKEKAGKGILLVKIFILVLLAGGSPLHAASSNGQETNLNEVNIVQQNMPVITGTVTDALGEPLIGVSVLVKGTSNGSITDIDGKYSIKAEPNAILIFSYVGYSSIEVKADKRAIVNVKLEEDAQALDEVVVVAYGTQKKVNMTGSVATIQSKKLESRPVVSLSSALSGLAAGVTIAQKSGNPGSEDTSIRVRGTGTFTDDYRGPMVIIDGSVGTMDSVNPDDVESISVLKDAASAAIYGSRAANGVILITTKRGKKEAAPRITYSGIFSSERATGNYDFITDYAEYMELFNRSMANVGQTGRYNQTTIDAWKKASQNPNGTDNEWNIANSLAYPNTDWYDALFQNKVFQKHNLSITGGSKNSNYLFSLMYMDNPGTMDNTGLKRYQFRVNLESKVGDYIKVGTQTFAMKQEKQQGNQNGALTYLFQTVPGMTPEHDGKFGYPEAAEEDGTANNLPWFLNNTGGTATTTRLNSTWYAEAELYKGLTARGNFNYQEYRMDDDSYSLSNDMYSFRTNDIKRYGANLKDATITAKRYKNHQYTASATLNYTAQFGLHSINALAGYEQFYYKTNNLNAQSKGLMDFSLTDISTATEMVRIWGGDKQEYPGQEDYGMLSYFGRINYNFNERYLFEANIRRDASSRFSPDYRWGNFPSFSAAWRISEEPFMASTKEFLDNLKLRASWGKLGNTTSGYYDWQASYDKRNYSFGGNIYNGLSQGKVSNPLLQWENISSTDIAVEATLLNQRLSVELGFYNKITEGILTTPPMYMTMGTVDAPTQNTSDMRNRGLELNLGWNDKIGKLRYAVSGNFAFNHNEIISYLGKLKEGYVTDKDGKKVYQSNIGDVASFNGLGIRTEGHMFDEFYMRTRYHGTGSYKGADGKVDPNGGPRDGMVRTPADLQWVNDMKAAGYGFQIGTVNKTGLWYGEMIMADLNGDGIYGNSYDRRFTGKSSAPKYSYGLNISAEWNGFDFSMQWAGNAGMYYYINERGIDKSNLDNRTVLASDARTKYYYYNEADPNDKANNINGKYPRLRYASNGAHIDNDLYLYDASYIKLKSLQIGYTFPKEWTNKVYINNLRVFLAGENLATITGFPGVDPEAGGSINIYPAAKQYSAGINLTF